MFKKPLFTYDSAKGLSLWRNCVTTSPPEPVPPDRDIFPRLEAFIFKSLEAVLFFPWEEGMLASPFRLQKKELQSPWTRCLAYL